MRSGGVCIHSVCLDWTARFRCVDAGCASKSVSCEDPEQSETDLYTSQLRRCAAVWSKTHAHEKAEPFRLPVDAEALGIPQYTRLIKYPMDLQTVSLRLVKGYYRSHMDFWRDMQVHVRLMHCPPTTAP